MTPEQMKHMEEQRKQAEEQREVMLNSICTAEARERLNRVTLVKPEKARHVEVHLLKMAYQRALPGKVTEEQVIGMIEKGASQTSGITIKRKKHSDSDDDIDLDDF